MNPNFATLPHPWRLLSQLFLSIISAIALIIIVTLWIPLTSRSQGTFNTSTILDINLLGSPSANVGDSIIYTATLQHHPDSDHNPTSNITLSGTLLFPTLPISGDINNDNMLDDNETWIYTTSYTIQPTDLDPLTHTVIVSAKTLSGSLIFPANSHTATHTLAVEYNPVLLLQKTGPDKAHIGDTVVYTFTVQHSINSDLSPISNIIVIDTNTTTPTLTKGDTSQDGQLNANETWVYTTTYIIKNTDRHPLVNTAQVNGLDQDGDIIQDSDAHVIVINGMTLEIIGPPTANADDLVTYRYEIGYTGPSSEDLPLSEITINSNLTGFSDSCNQGDNGNQVLDYGEIWYCDINYHIPYTQGEQLINEINAIGLTDNQQIITATTSHTLSVSLGPRKIYMPIILKNPACSNVYINDDFSDNTTGWLVSNYNEADYDYVYDNTNPIEYQIYSKIGQTRSASPYGAFEEYSVSVDVNWDQFPLGDEYGLIFGLTGKDSKRVIYADALYNFTLDTEGIYKSYSLYAYNPNYYGNYKWHPIVDWQINNEIINPDLETNTLSVKCYKNPDTVSLYTNEQLLWNGTLPFACAGEIGLSSSVSTKTIPSSSTESHFDNFRLCGTSTLSIYNKNAKVIIPININKPPK